jgi:beta-lactamase regulating signal transducer with metallopeptidase domain
MMSSLDGVSRLWLAQLAFTMAIVAVLALRRLCRRWFGAERAFQLWMLPPLAMLVSQLPHATASTAAAPTLVYVIATAGGALPGAKHAQATGGAWSMILVAWGLGVAVVVLLGALAQLRYRRRMRGARPWREIASRWPVWIAVDPGTGPALVGAWRPRIVLPADFAARYDACEQTLVLAHEEAHARRRDGWWSLCAFAVLALCWPHTLAWFSWWLFRRDQEFACDAAVMRIHHARRRHYAEAMLKTQPAGTALPVGCTWSPVHPLTERIAMLKYKPGSTRRARLGGAALAACAAVMAGAVYAATPSGGAMPVAADRYALQMDVAYDGDAPSTHMRQCVKVGESVSISGSADDIPGWQGRFAVAAVDGGMLEVQGDLSGGPLDNPVHPKVRTRPGQTATIQVGEVNHGNPKASHGIRIDLTPRFGC